MLSIENKLNLDNLIIEVTRKCNMCCDHCLRGEMENMDMKKEYIDSLLDNVCYISMVTFTGGEPSLNVPIMEYFLQEVKNRKIEISGFYIATNGKHVKEDFILFCLKMFSYCYEKEICRVDCSNDYFHQLEGGYNLELLEGLSFFGKKYETDGFNYNNNRGLINEGYSEENGIGHRHLDVKEVEYLEDLTQNIFYLSCEGTILNDCDMSYRNQENHLVCTLEELPNFVTELIEKEEIVYS
jgi:hypothetical protein